MRALPWLLVLLAAIVLPAAGAQEAGEDLCIIFVRPTADFSVVEISADLILDPDERANISAAVDGDDDGNLTSAETSAYEQNVTRTYDGGAIPTERLLTLDGARPTSLTIYTRLQNWTGPAAEASKGIVTEARYYRFDAPNSTEHSLSGNVYIPPSPDRLPPNVVVEVVIIEAPDGWRVRRIAQVAPDGTTGNQSFPDEPTVRLSGFDLSKGAIDFRQDAVEVESPPTPQETPAPGLAALAAILAIAAWSRRSPRRR